MPDRNFTGIAIGGPLNETVQSFPYKTMLVGRYDGCGEEVLTGWYRFSDAGEWVYNPELPASKIFRAKRSIALPPRRHHRGAMRTRTARAWATSSTSSS